LIFKYESFNHNQLYDLIKTKKNWLITYNNCDYIRELYKDYKILEVDWKYGMNKTKASSEIIILSLNHRIPF
jgi:DNA adenine methylase